MVSSTFWFARPGARTRTMAKAASTGSSLPASASAFSTALACAVARLLTPTRLLLPFAGAGAMPLRTTFPEASFTVRTTKFACAVVGTLERVNPILPLASAVALVELTSVTVPSLLTLESTTV